jgi:hypothetical protein
MKQWTTIYFIIVMIFLMSFAIICSGQNKNLKIHTPMPVKTEIIRNDSTLFERISLISLGVGIIASIGGVVKYIISKEMKPYIEKIDENVKDIAELKTNTSAAVEKILGQIENINHDVHELVRTQTEQLNEIRINCGKNMASLKDSCVLEKDLAAKVNNIFK